MSFDIVDLAVITIGAIIGVIALAISRLRVGPSEKKTTKDIALFF